MDGKKEASKGMGEGTSGDDDDEVEDEVEKSDFMKYSCMEIVGEVFVKKLRDKRCRIKKDKVNISLQSI